VGRTTCNFLTGLQIRKHVPRRFFIYANLLCISSKYLPTGRQESSTSICQQSSARTALLEDGAQSSTNLKQVTNAP
jgi:hypothetical protein